MQDIQLQLAPELTKILDIVARQGQAYLVGGAVRDYFHNGTLGDDVDITTNVDIDQLAAIFKREGYRQDKPVGKSFRTFRLILPDNTHVDIAQFRSEEYDESSRKPITTAALTLDQDLSRRDAPFNSIALEYQGNNQFTVHDPYGGLEDLKKGIVHAVGDADSRLREDPLRALRYIGFASQYNFEVDPKVIESIRNNLPRMDIVSRDRINEEVLKRLDRARPELLFKFLHDTGLLAYIFPQFARADEVVHDSRGGHYGESLYQHTYDALSRVPDNASVEFKLAVMLHDIGKTLVQQTENGKIMFKGHDEAGADALVPLLTKLRFKNDIVNYVSKMTRYHMQLNNLTYLPNPKKPLVSLFQELSENEPFIQDLISLSEIDQSTQLPAFHQQVAEWSRIPKFINGDDVLAYLASPPRMDENGHIDQLAEQTKRTISRNMELVGSLVKQMRFIQLTQNKNREQLLKILGGEANNLAEPFSTQISSSRTNNAIENAQRHSRQLGV